VLFYQKEANKMQLSLLTEKDISRIQAIENAAYKTPWTEDTFRRCFEVHYVLLGLTDDDDLLGYVIFSIQVGECHILNLAVHPDQQRKGFGRKLLLAALSAGKENGATIAYLEVRRSNKHAIALYHEVDFIQIGERKNYYPTDKGRENALVFAKDLTIE
jgi:[ribosomal protein S18]-alanine N-acetyltransferase